MTLNKKPVNEKLKQSFLYVISRYDDKETLGITKICKLLYFADFNYYKKNNIAITGTDYLRWEHGPLPSGIYEVISELKDEGKISITDRELNDEIIQKEFTIVEEQNFDYISDKEKRELDKVLDKLGRKTGAELERLSHLDTPWEVTLPRKKIKYKLVFYRDDNIALLVE